MNQAPQFYKKIVALNENKHRALRLRPAGDYSFARETNAVVLAAAEFAFAALEYPIVFLEVGGGVTPVAVLGLEPGQNLFLAKDGTWDAHYVPAYVRRYPFMISRSEADTQQMTVCVDESSDRLSETEGDRLFGDDGKPTAYLDRVLEFLKDFDRQARITEGLCTRLASSKLLEPMQAKLNFDGGPERSVGGFLAVERARLTGLGAEVIFGLAEKGELELIYTHLLSLRNFAVLADRSKKTAGAPKPRAKSNKKPKTKAKARKSKPRS